MAKLKSIYVDKNMQIKFDKKQLNKEIFWPVAKAGLDVAEAYASEHKKTGQLLKNIKTVSLNNLDKKSLGYVLVAGRRSDYRDQTPHFVVFMKHENGKAYRAIKRAMNAQIKQITG